MQKAIISPLEKYQFGKADPCFTTSDAVFLMETSEMDALGHQCINLRKKGHVEPVVSSKPFQTNSVR
jgi:hypothetical protein